MYNLDNNPLHWQYCVIYKSVVNALQLFVCVFEIKHQLLHFKHILEWYMKCNLEHYFPQLRNIKGFEYFEHSN